MRYDGGLDRWAAYSLTDRDIVGPGPRPLYDS